MPYQLRLARPVSNLSRARDMYCVGLGLRVLGSFEDHDGFDGVMIGRQGRDWHLEFTHCRNHQVQPAPTAEDLVVLYVADRSEWEAACARMLVAGFARVTSFNPYWEMNGQTFEDPDGYRVVLQNDEWASAASE